MNSSSRNRYRLGVDVGGTFTDIVLVDAEGRIFYTKTPSTPRNQSIGVLSGISKVMELYGVNAKVIDQVVHGTTVATNALLERKGSRTALLTTVGFKDVFCIGRQTRTELYNLMPQRPEQIIPRHLIHEIQERVIYTGEVLRDINDEEIRSIIGELKRDSVEAIAICFLHSYINPIHEEQVDALIHREYPDLHVTISSHLLREFREYERMNATVINAYVAKVMDTYLSSIVTGLKDVGIEPPLTVMQSNGGFMHEEIARQRSVATLLSGPAAGVLGTSYIGRLCGYDDIISADMGGTSFDISLIEEGKPAMVTENDVGGFPLNMAMIDIHTIGAGGGSIAWIDSGGILQVGPQSAGAEPGPVCYGKGGTEPTVTDANLLLGRLNPDFLLGGGLQLDIELAKKVVKTKIAEPLGITVEQSCEGIIAVINASMVRGIRVVSIEKGYDARRFVLLAFGGAGPLHASALARELKMPKVVIPLAPGNFSTLGLLTGDVKYNYVQTYVSNEKMLDYKKMNAIYHEMEVPAVARLKKNEGFSDTSISVQREVDLRYVGQSYELTVPIESGEIGLDTFRQAKEKFHQAHIRAYGFARENEAIEVVNLRLTCIGQVAPPILQKNEFSEFTMARETKGNRHVYFDGKWFEINIFDREKLKSGNQIEGPAIIEEVGSTAVVYPGDQGYIDEYGNIIIEINV